MLFPNECGGLQKMLNEAGAGNMTPATPGTSFRKFAALINES